MPIDKHPHYQNLMAKYAIRDTSTCPPIYKPCNLKYNSNGQIITTSGDTIVYQSTDGTVLYKLNASNQIIKVFNGQEIQLEGLLPKTNINDFDITTHVDYPKILEIYALRDNTTCPPSYKPCKTLAQYDITHHPDINNYILKTQIPKCIDYNVYPNDTDMMKKCRQHFSQGTVPPSSLSC